MTCVVSFHRPKKFLGESIHGRDERRRGKEPPIEGGRELFPNDEKKTTIYSGLFLNYMPNNYLSPLYQKEH